MPIFICAYLLIGIVLILPLLTNILPTGSPGFLNAIEKIQIKQSEKGLSSEIRFCLDKYHSGGTTSH